MLKRVVLICFLFVLFVLFWLVVNFYYTDKILQDYFSDSYGIVSLLGGVFGLLVARKWGYFRSHIGSLLAFLSLGLLFQFFGQLGYTLLYRLHGIENAYPAFCEVFFVLSVPCYFLGGYYMVKISGLKVLIINKRYLFIAVCLFLSTMTFSYLMFLKGYDFSEGNLVNNFLSVYYPIGQSLFLFMGIVAFLVNYEHLGGLLRLPFLLVILALILQYTADTLFLYENVSGIWYPASFSSLLFLVSYSFLSLALLFFDKVFNDARSRRQF